MEAERTMADELRDVQRAIAAHPGYQEHLKLQALERSIADVFIPNRNLLLSLLEAASTKWQLAFELIQNKPDQKMESEVQLNVVELLEWDGWSSAARAYLRGLGEDEAVSLRPVLQMHADLVLALNVWLLRELSEANATAPDDVNELVVAGNAILTGGEMEEARRMAQRYDLQQ